MPPALGTKIMAVGQIAASICASCPAPEVMRRTLIPRARVTFSIRRAILSSNWTGGVWASRVWAMEKPSRSRMS